MAAVSDRLQRQLADRRAAGRTALICYLTAGDPDLQTSLLLARAVAAVGADVIEFGVPFSDPLADGPVIQAATQRALAAGATPEAVLALVRRFRAADPVTPAVLMGYYNPILRRGIEAYCAAAAAAGADGLIVPDLPHEEAGDLRAGAATRGLALVPLVAPTAGEDRVAAICRQAAGFVYCVAVKGVTGARDGLSEAVPTLVARVRRHTDLPVAVGFGIGTPAAAAAAGAVADAVVVGSALVRLCGLGLPPGELLDQAAALVGDLRAALGRSR